MTPDKLFELVRYNTEFLTGVQRKKLARLLDEIQQSRDLVAASHRDHVDQPYVHRVHEAAAWERVAARYADLLAEGTAGS